MIKLSFIKKLPNGDYRVLSEQGRNLGTYPSRDEAIKRLKQVEMFKHMKRKKKASKEGIDLTDVDSLSYSGVLRELRQTASDEVIRDFLMIYRAAFDKMTAIGIADVADKALEFVLKFLDNKYGVTVPEDDSRKPLGQITAPRFSQVTEGVWRGGAPTIEDVERMAQKGIKRIISLDYDVAAEIDNQCRKSKIQHIVIPIMAKDFKTLRHFPKLDWASLFHDGGPSYVHCLHGKDRTGLVVALFRCQQGMPCSQAIKEADKFGFCLGLPKAVRAYYCGLLREACQHPEEHKDSNMVHDLLWPDYLGDYKYNNDYLPHDPSFAVRLYEETGPLGQRVQDEQENLNIPEYKVKDIPQVGIIENVSNVTTPGPAGIGTGYIAIV